MPTFPKGINKLWNADGLIPAKLFNNFYIAYLGLFWFKLIVFFYFYVVKNRLGLKLWYSFTLIKSLMYADGMDSIGSLLLSVLVGYHSW